MSTVFAPTPAATYHTHATREAGKRHTMSSPRPIATSAAARPNSNSRHRSSPTNSPTQRDTQAGSNQSTEEHRDAPADSDESSPDKRTSHESHAKLNALADVSSAASQPAIKQERPPSPEMTSTRSSSTTRHRPSRLDLTNSTPVNIAPNPNTAGLASSREPRTGQLTAMQDVGLACISPGFQTDNPSMQQQLAKALQTRDQQRHIIESRLNKTGNETIAPAGKVLIETVGPGGPLTSRPPASSKRRGPPPGLSINAPNASHFSNEPRVVQSAPLNQSFTGLRVGATGPEGPLSRQVLQHSHRQEHPAPPQTAHRLPPIQDVLNHGDIGSRPPHQLHRTNSGQLYAPITNAQPSKSPVTAHHPGRHSPPGYPPQSAGYPPHHREHHSGDEAQAHGGRREEIPKIVHYGGHQPPTPPSPLPPNHQHPHHQHHGYPQQQGSSSSHASSNRSDPGRTGRRRTREEFEQDAYMEQERSRRHEAVGSAGMLWEAKMRTDSPETSRRKKEEFMSLVSRAWDLLKS